MDNPGRWNSFDGYPFTLVAERGMNAPGFTATARTIAAMPVKGRRLLLLGAVGNRSNEQYRELAGPLEDGDTAFSDCTAKYP